MRKKIQKGDIYFVDFEPVKGTEITKIRPALVVSKNSINSFTEQVICIPFTANNFRVQYPDTLLVRKSKTNGLREDSVLFGIHLRSFDQLRLGYKVGVLESKYFLPVENLLVSLFDVEIPVFDF